MIPGMNDTVDYKGEMKVTFKDVFSFFFFQSLSWQIVNIKDWLAGKNLNRQYSGGDFRISLTIVHCQREETVRHVGMKPLT